jgi:hypothetical protein
MYVSQPIFANINTQHKVNNRPIGENSPNVVTLLERCNTDKGIWLLAKVVSRNGTFNDPMMLILIKVFMQKN